MVVGWLYKWTAWMSLYGIFSNINHSVNNAHIITTVMAKSVNIYS